MPAISGTQYASRTDLANLGLIGAALQSVAVVTQDAALLAASGLIDSYLGRYTLPLATWGQDLVRAASIIASYDIMTTRGYSPLPTNADQNIRQRYLDVIKWLEDVRDGVTPLAVIDPAGSSPSSGGDLCSSASRGEPLIGMGEDFQC